MTAARRGPFASRLALLVALLGSACNAERPSPASAAPADEQLIASPPPGWVQVGGLSRGDVRIAEYGDPATLTPTRVDSIRFESLGGKPLPDPIDIVVATGLDLSKRCEGFQDTPIFSGYENGYPTSVRLMFCRQQGRPPWGEVRMVKAIRGNEHVYIISRSRRTPPLQPHIEPLSAAEMASWSYGFSLITVCDPRDPGHPCP
jgi:hypothetical protein